LVTPSSGRGARGGIGDSEGSGVGKTPGVGYGPGGRGGSGITAPRVLYNPDPEFSEEARKAKYQGTVRLWAVIGADGRPRDIRVQQSLGMGLDEKAVEALRMWRFQPGTKDGHPVAVEISVEVNFHLF
jgi:TonB family protein